MSFKTEIEAIVGDIDSPDVTTEAGLYLVEGVKFITKSLMNIPEIAERLTSSTSLSNSPSTLDTSAILKVISVTRNDGARGRHATRILSNLKDDYTDVNSIYYTSKYDPKYYIENDILNIIPTPTASETATIIKIEPDTSVVVGDTAIDNFPKELERGVILYASKELLRLFLNQRNTTLTGLNLADVSPPSAINVDNLAIAELPDPPAYNKVSLSIDYGAPGDLGVDDYLAGEDVELAEIALTKVQQSLSKHQNDIQDELNEFNAQLADYNTEVQRLIEQGGLDGQEATLKVQNYQAQVESYAQQVNEEVQKYSLSLQEVVQDYNWYAQQYQIVLQDLSNFLGQYIPMQPQEVPNEASANG